MKLIILAALVAAALVFGAKGCGQLNSAKAPAPSQRAEVSPAVQRDWAASDAGFRAGRKAASEQPGLAADAVRALGAMAHLNTGYYDRPESFTQGFVNGYNYKP